MGRMRNTAYLQIYIAVIVLFISGLMQFFFYTFANRLSFKVKMAYFRSCLEKDAAYYDQFSPTEIPARIVKETEQIRAGMGDKIGMCFQACSMLIAGFALAFVLGHQLAGWLMLFFPVFGLLGCCFWISISGGMREIAKTYAQSAGYAEQALASIKVVHSYGQEALEGQNYEKHLVKSQDAQARMTRNMAIAFAAIFSFIYFYYGYALYLGGLFRTNEVEVSPGRLYSGGIIVGCMTSILIASFQLGNIT